MESLPRFFSRLRLTNGFETRWPRATSACSADAPSLPKTNGRSFVGGAYGERNQSYAESSKKVRSARTRAGMVWVYWLKCNGTQGNAVPPPPIYGSKRSPISDFYNARERYATIVRGQNLNVAFPHGATENAGVENAGVAKMQGWKTQEWKTQESEKYGKRRFQKCVSDYID